MSYTFPKIETIKQVIGEYPMHQIGDQIGLYDGSEATLGEKPATNLEVLQMLAQLAGGEVYLTNPVSQEGKNHNSSITRNFHGQQWANDLFKTAVIFERPL